MRALERELNRNDVVARVKAVERVLQTERGHGLSIENGWPSASPRNATRGNIDVTLTANGQPAWRGLVVGGSPAVGYNESIAARATRRPTYGPLDADLRRPPGRGAEA